MLHKLEPIFAQRLQELGGSRVVSESMYHHQGKNGILTSRPSLNPDRHLLLQSANVSGDTGLVLSTDAKPRLKWTPELHERFIEAVNQLGGADKATPKTIMRLMGIPGLTLYHLKSHLQKFRLSKNLQAQGNSGINKNVSAERSPDVGGTSMASPNPSQMNKTLQISEALQMQIEVQRKLHEQLEVQRHLQLRIEAQGKYLQTVLEKAQETLGRQSFGSPGFEDAKLQLSELVSEVSNECLNTSFPGQKETQSMQGLPAQKNQFLDYSIDSCLTSSESSHKDREMHNINMNLRTYIDELPLCTSQHGLHTAWADSLNGCKMYSSSTVKDPDRIIPPARRDDMSMGIKHERDHTGSGTNISEARRRDREIENICLGQADRERTAFEHARERGSGRFGQANVTVELDLNTHDDENVGAAPSFRQFDLNGFSWS